MVPSVTNRLEKKFAKVEKKRAEPAKPKAKKNVPLIAHIVGIGVGLIIGLNVAIYLNKLLVDDVKLAQLQAKAQENTLRLAANAEKYIASVNEKMASIANNSEFLLGLAERRQEDIDTAKIRVLAEVERALAVDFIYRGEAALNENANPPIRFTELELIRRTEDREVVQPEAAKIDTEWRINLVQPVPLDPAREFIATMLLSLSIEKLQEVIVDGKVSLGHYVLQQKFGNNKPVDIFSIGSGSAASAVVEPIKNTYWQIKYTPTWGLVADDPLSFTKAYAIIVGVVVFIVFVCLLIGRVIGVLIDQKMKEKTAQAEKIQALDKSSVLTDGVMVNPLYQANDVLDVEIASEDTDLLGLEEVVAKSVADHVFEEDVLDIDDHSDIPDSIFRAYDIRGIAGEQITDVLSEKIGRALGSEAIDGGQDTLIVARDARLTSPQLTEALIRGILSSGCNVLNIGIVPTPLMYYAAATLKESQSGVMVTASHNPGEYNGFKVVMNGKARSDEDIKAIRRRIIKGDIYEGLGKETHHDIVASYIDTIFSDVALAGDVNIVIDAANGVTGLVAPKLFEELGCYVTPLFCEPDGHFPNHSPDPSIESNLQALIDKVKEVGAHLGVAFDGDGDRVIVVTSSGRIIWPDQLLILFAKDILSRNPGADVVFDVKSTRHLARCITDFGGRPIMWKTGHAPMKNKMLESDALLGGEYSGHIFIKDRWFGFDDGMYAAARLIEILSLQGQTLDEIFAEFPSSPATPEIRIPIHDEKKFYIISKLQSVGDFGDGQVTKIDGVRVDYPYGWGLVRASNTSPNLTLRFEADDEESLSKIKSIIAQQLNNIDKSIIFNGNS